jgi:pimeloyl-ACP methyl ester carboxylesterase
MWNISHDSYDAALERVLRRVDQTIDDVGDRYPVFADSPDGRWTTSRRGSWVPGFWVGMLWLRAHCTREPAAVELARRWCRRLADRLTDNTGTRAMTFWHGAALGTILFGDADAEQLAVQGAAALADSFDPTLGIIAAGDAFDPADRSGMNSHVFAATSQAVRAYLEEQALPERLATLGKPLLVIFGEDDRRWRSSSAAEYRARCCRYSATYVDPVVSPQARATATRLVPRTAGS